MLGKLFGKLLKLFSNDIFMVKWNIMFVILNALFIMQHFMADHFGWQNAVSILIFSIAMLYHARSIIQIVARLEYKVLTLKDMLKVRVKDNSQLHLPTKPDFVSAHKVQAEIENAIRLAIALGQEHKAQALLSDFTMKLTDAEAALYKDLYEITHHKADA